MRLIVLFLLPLFLGFCPHANAEFGQTAKNVASAGTAEAISATNLQVKSAVIQAKLANTGNIYIGTSAVDNTGNTGTTLSAGQAYVLAKGGSDDLYNLKDLYIDADTNGEGITITYFSK